MTNILKLSLVIVNIALSLGMFFIAVRSMKNDHLARRDDSGYSIASYKSFFNKCVGVGIVVKFFYWLVIPDVNSIVSYMIMFDMAMCVLIIAAAFLFMLPLHLIKKDKFVKCSVASSVLWIIRAAVAVLAYCILAYFISAPVVI